MVNLVKLVGTVYSIRQSQNDISCPRKSLKVDEDWLRSRSGEPKIMDPQEQFGREKEKDFPTVPYGELNFDQRLLVKSFAPVLLSDDQAVKQHLLKELQFLSELIQAREKAKPRKKKIETRLEAREIG